MARILAFLILGVLFRLPVAWAEVLTGQIVEVIDGDTLILREDAKGQKVTVRLAAIDAPEKTQPAGAASRRMLSEAVFLQTVNVETRGRDDYGRTLGVVYVMGESINLRLVREGWAWAYRSHLGTDGPRLLAAEAEARRQRRGLWSDESPQAPWEFRHRKLPAAAVSKASSTSATPPVPTIEQMFAETPEWGSWARAREASGHGGMNGSGEDRGPWHTGPRGGHYTVTSGGNRNYAPRR